MPPRPAPAAGPPEASPPPPGESAVNAPTLYEFGTLAESVRHLINGSLKLQQRQERANWSVAIALLSILCLLVIQDREIQALQKAVKSLRS